MMQDRYRGRYRVPAASDRVRRQIAIEAARRLYGTLIRPGSEAPPGWLDLAGPGDFYVAKRKAAAVLGHRVRPGDLPSDSEVREELISLRRDSGERSGPRRTRRNRPPTPNRCRSPIISIGLPCTRCDYCRWNR